MRKKSTNLPINQIICGDCRDIMKNIPDGSVDLILTDPPYGIDYDKVQGSRPREKKRRAIIGDKKEMNLGFLLERPELKIVFGAQNFWRQIPTIGRWLCWDKRVLKANQALGSQFELAWISKEMGYYKIYRVLHSGYINNDLYYGESKRWHPTQKPINLMRLIIEDYSKPGDVILDPFCGAGGTCIAAAITGRKYIGIDIDKAYCRIVRERIERIKRRLM